MKYKVRLGRGLLAEFFIGWILLAWIFSTTSHPPALFLLNAPLIPFYVVFTCVPKGGYWLFLLLIVALIASVLLPFLKQKWAKFAYLAAAMIIVYWLCCALAIQAILKA